MTTTRLVRRQIPRFGDVVDVEIDGIVHACRVVSLLETEPQVIYIGVERGGRVIFAVAVIPPP